MTGQSKDSGGSAMTDHDDDHLPAIQAVPKNGDESFHVAGEPLEFDLQSYWRWTASDLLNNTSRGNLAEFIIGKALGVASPLRATWDEYDLLTNEGLRIEVKSAAYIQSWGQKKHSRPTFGISPSRSWDEEKGRMASALRHSDVYVFALLHHKEQQSIDPTDLSQWTFYVLPTRVLDERCPSQKTIGLSTLRALGAQKTGFDGLRDAVLEMADRTA
jgi:hypothetical protein